MADASTSKPYDICTVPEGETVEARLLLALLRDGVIVALLLGGALWLDGWAQQSSFSLAGALSGVGAFLAGLLANGLLHEWGHYAGAKLTGSTAPREPLTSVFPMFHFDIERNNDRQFVAMSLGGNLVQWLFAFTLVLLVGTSTIGQTALLCGAVAFALFGSITEVPIIRDALVRGSAVEAWHAYLPNRGRRIRRAVVLGSFSTVALFLFL